MSDSPRAVSALSKPNRELSSYVSARDAFFERRGKGFDCGCLVAAMVRQDAANLEHRRRVVCFVAGLVAAKRLRVTSPVVNCLTKLLECGRSLTARTLELDRKL